MIGGHFNLDRLATYAIIGGGLLIFKGLKRFYTALKVKGMAPIKIAAAPMGLVELEGFAWPLANLENTCFEGSPAVFVNLRMMCQSENQYNSNKIVWEYTSPFPFLIMDNTGAAIVFPKQAQRDVHTETIRWNSLSADQQTRFQEKNALTSSPFQMGTMGKVHLATYLLEERSIKIGCPLFIEGTLTPTVQTPNTVDWELATEFVKLARAFQINPSFMAKGEKSLKTWTDISEQDQRRIFTHFALDMMEKSKKKSTKPVLSQTDPSPHKPKKNNYAQRIYGAIGAQEHFLLYDRFKASALQGLQKWKFLDILLGIICVAWGIQYIIRFSKH